MNVILVLGIALLVILFLGLYFMVYKYLNVQRSILDRLDFLCEMAEIWTGCDCEDEEDESESWKADEPDYEDT
jgi:hypothetical protein